MAAAEHEPGGALGTGAAAPASDADLDLVRAALAGSAPAVDALACRMGCLGRIVAGLNARMAHGLGRDELDDVVQNVAANVWTRLAHYQGKAPLEAWLFAFCDHELRNSARSKRRRRAALAPLVDEFAARPPLDTTFADELRDCLRRLAQWDQQAIHARHDEGLSLQEMAVRFACNVNTIKSRYYRSTRQLRECLEGKGVA